MTRYSLGLYEKAMPDGLSFREMLELTARTGFDRLELSVDESEMRLARLDWTSDQVRALKRQVDDSGVLIRTMCLSGHRKYPLGSHDFTIRERSLEIMRKAINLAAELGIAIIQLAGYDVYYETGDADTRAWFAENLAISTEIAAKAGVLLGFETMETSFMDTVGKAMAYVNLIGSPYLGVYPDIGNLKNAAVLYSSDLLADLELGRGHTYAAHLKETVPGVYRNMVFGAGHTQYQECIRVLWDMGVRMFTGEFWYDGKSEIESYLVTSSKFLRNQIETAIASFRE
jgi:predicted hexulose-6-phosphate isomerase